MSKFSWCSAVLVSFLIISLIVFVGIQIQSSEDESQQHTSLSDVNNTTKTAPQDEINRFCKLADESAGQCVKREMCNNTFTQIQERFSGDNEEDCESDEENVICCSNDQVVSNEKQSSD
jgi:hypothetical protein